MNFQATEEQQAVVEVVSQIARDLVDGAARQAEVDQAAPDKIRRVLLEAGIFPNVPEAYGGGGAMDPLLLMLSSEALAYGDGGIAFATVMNANVAMLISACGADAQKIAHLTGFASDPNIRSGLALYEGFGRAPTEYRTKFTRAGGRWRVTGAKLGVPNGTSADLFLVVGTDAISGQLRAALVDSNVPGVKVTSTAPIIGLDAAAMASLAFDVEIDETAMLGGVHADPEALSTALSVARLTLAAVALGCATRANAYAAKYSAERIAFGRPIAGFQAVSHMIADSEIEIQAARIELWDIISRIATMAPDTLESWVAMVLAACSSAATLATRNAIQVLGGHGFLNDHPVERWYRTAAGLSTLDLDIQSASFVASL